MISSEHVPSPPKILVVEDEPDIMLVLRLWLASAGYAVIEAQTGAEALVHASEADVVILDLRLPDMDGWTLLDQIRSDPRTRSLPVVVASAHAGGSTARRAAEQGCGYVSKPFNPETVMTAVKSRLDRRGLSVSNLGR